MLAAILTIGNELVSGDTPNTNASWLAKRLESLGVRVVLIATVPDELDRIVDVLQREMPRVDHLIVTGGLGGTPDDITREAVAAAFGVEQEVVPELADDLRSRFTGAPEYAARWAALPVGSRPLVNPPGGAPGFQLGNVWVLPGLPREMEAMFDHYAEEFRAERPIGVWRRGTQTAASRRSPTILVEATERWPTVTVGSYPSFQPAARRSRSSSSRPTPTRSPRPSPGSSRRSQRPRSRANKTRRYDRKSACRAPRDLSHRPESRPAGGRADHRRPAARDRRRRLRQDPRAHPSRLRTCSRRQGRSRTRSSRSRSRTRLRGR